jgi:hypothetical protein
MSNLPKYLDISSAVQDMVMTDKREVYLNPIGRIDGYTTNSEVIFSLPANGLLDCQNSYLSFIPTFTRTTGSSNIAIVQFDSLAGFHQMINRVCVYSGSGVLLQELNEYHIWAALTNAMKSADYERTAIAYEGGAYDLPTSEIPKVQRGTCNTNTTNTAQNLDLIYNYENGGYTATANGNITTPRLYLNLKTLFGRDSPLTYWPLNALSQEVRIHFFFNQLNASAKLLNIENVTYNSLQMRLNYVTPPTQIMNALITRPMRFLYDCYAHQKTIVDLQTAGSSTTINSVIRQPYSRVKYVFVTHRMTPNTVNANSCAFHLPTVFQANLEIQGRRYPQNSFNNSRELWLEWNKICNGVTSTHPISETSDSFVNASFNVTTTLDHVRNEQSLSNRDRKCIVAFDLRNWSQVNNNIPNQANGMSVALKEFQYQAIVTPTAFTDAGGLVTLESEQMTVDFFIVYETEAVVASGDIQIAR